MYRTPQNQVRIDAIQQRANEYGFALAMCKPPTTYADIQRVVCALDDIITELE